MSRIVDPDPSTVRVEPSNVKLLSASAVLLPPSDVSILVSPALSIEVKPGP
jgi:hypothetical protein